MTLDYFTGFNAFLLFIPILFWNAVFYKKLPVQLQKEPANLPVYISRTETILRVAVFGLPFIIPLNEESRFFLQGIALWSCGTIFYFATWIPLMWKPQAKLVKRIAVWTAPAWSPAFFLSGIILLSESWIYGMFCVMFIASHLYHEIFRYRYYFSKE